MDLVTRPSYGAKARCRPLQLIVMGRFLLPASLKDPRSSRMQRTFGLIRGFRSTLLRSHRGTGTRGHGLARRGPNAAHNKPTPRAPRCHLLAASKTGDILATEDFWFSSWLSVLCTCGRIGALPLEAAVCHATIQIHLPRPINAQMMSSQKKIGVRYEPNPFCEVAYGSNAAFGSTTVAQRGSSRFSFRFFSRTHNVRIVSGAPRDCEAAQRCSRRITIS